VKGKEEVIQRPPDLVKFTGTCPPKDGRIGRGKMKPKKKGQNIPPEHICRNNLKPLNNTLLR